MIFHFLPLIVKYELFSNAALFTLKYQIKNKLQKEFLPNTFKVICENILTADE